MISELDWEGIGCTCSKSVAKSFAPALKISVLSSMGRRLRGPAVWVLPESEVAHVLPQVRQDAEAAGFQWVSQTPSPIKGSGGNVEILAMLIPRV